MRDAHGFWARQQQASGYEDTLVYSGRGEMTDDGTTNDKLDLNGDADQLDGGEWNDTRGFNEVNELLGRNLDSSGISYDSEPVYNGKGELTDDDESNLFDYDYWGRPRKVKNKVGGAVVSEYRYNGFGWRISFSDESTSHTYHLVYDDHWRNIATYIDSDDPADPKERMVYDNAGMMGYGGASYIDSIVLRDKDANTAWTSASDGTLEERIYLLQNWRSDVVMLLEATGSGNAEQVEHVRYEAYGTPTALPAGDTDRDGDTDSTDTTQIDTWISGTTWTARGDLDLDNDVDAADKTLAMGMSSANGGRGILSDRGNRKGYAGYEWDQFAVHDSWNLWNRSYDSTVGRFASRAELSHIPNLYLPLSELEECDFTHDEETALSSSGGRPWYCNAKCNVAGNEPQCYNRTVSGVGMGSSRYSACLAAQRDANRYVPRGCYKRHCNCICAHGSRPKQLPQPTPQPIPLPVPRFAPPCILRGPGVVYPTPVFTPAPGPVYVPGPPPVRPTVSPRPIAPLVIPNPAIIPKPSIPFWKRIPLPAIPTFPPIIPDFLLPYYPGDPRLYPSDPRRRATITTA